MKTLSAREAVDHLSRKHAKWKTNRWVTLVLAMVIIVGGIISPMIMKDRLVDLYAEHVIPFSQDPGDPWRFDRFVGGHFMTIYMRSLWISSFMIASGAILLVLTAMNWRGNAKEILLLELAQRTGIFDESKV